MKNTSNDFLDGLTPAQEHFLKKYLLEYRLSDELHTFSRADVCELVGFPFKTTLKKSGFDVLPLSTFYMRNFVAQFPFIASNSDNVQRAFWQETVQPFVESFNSKNISSSEERQTNATKRRQVNKKFLSGMLLFYNSVIITNKELTYLNESHLKPSDTGKMDKFSANLNDDALCVDDIDKHDMKKFHHNLSINIVALRRTGAAVAGTPSNSISSWSPMRFVTSSRPSAPRHHYEFVIQVTTRESVDGNFQYKSHFIARHYHEFKTLESKLKRHLPGVMSTEVSELPRKFSNDNGYNDIAHEKDTESELASLSSTVNGSSKTTKLVREKLRLSLRGYLRTLSKYPEIVHSDIFLDFIDHGSFNYRQLSEVELEDHKNRIEHERTMLKTQVEFQKQTAKVIVNLTKDFESLKKDIIMNPSTLSGIFDQIGKSSDIKKQTPFLKTLNEWCKLEAAATLYQVFLSQDNSNDWLNRCRKFHRLFPYNLVYGILRFTNPLKIVSRIVDLLLVNIPTVSIPSWGSKDEEELKEIAKKSGSRNLLSMIFVMLLDESLSSYETELKLLREEKLDSEYEIFLERIERYTDVDYAVVDAIKRESYEKSQDLLLTVLSTDLIKPPLRTIEDKYKYSQIVKSQMSYDQLAEHKNVVDSALYLNLKQYWQVQIRKKDADLFKQLWKEPELTKLIKNFLMVFYQPMMRIFTKADIHVVFRDFQKFMDDLMKELSIINNQEIYYLNSFEVFDRLKSLFDKHEDVLWKFIHTLYVKDDEHLFKGLVLWIEKFLVALRIKFFDEETVKLNLSSANLGIDEELFLKQLNSRAERTILRRKLFKEFLEVQASTGDETAQDKIDSKWEEVNNQLYGEFNTKGLGIDLEDVEEFNHLNAEEDLGDHSNERVLKQKLFDLEKNLVDYGTSELDKLDDSVKSQLSTLLTNLKI
ncbi:predicted protein [Scheffersomyces stipitis CBS 6054]|uniref:PX domain-containing protein n=1 Tax=Scheffersomyces stipitis (strain ATCC 58785 / CBS 6054 / NBRC 10063 / NRRL Y-11545) TaxID=322104 RepID=A3LRJ8_PICST|nr:predicted protein [Scheffersomyces stipitis CBS 6054]ABN65748.2 predicted protein [Scheffersomyces stipitis CBS 6054]KAG2734001.1 hypothetical protein G9P44_003526 [Scheffersomyces stipitis]